LFAALYKDRLRFDHKRKRWLIWGEHHWREDEDGALRRYAKNAARQREVLARPLEEKEHEKQRIWAFESESRSRLDATLILAQSEVLLADAGTEWDADPWLLGVPNGVVDLRAGGLRVGRQNDKITVVTKATFDAQASCPRWHRFLNEIFEGDTELIDYVWRAVGYSASGHTSEQCLFLCHGRGANGKSTLLETLRFALGEYAYNTPFSTLELQSRSSIPNDVAALAGRRLVVSSETNESSRFNEARVKALTGGDTITARLLYKEFFEFGPTAKYWLALNHVPSVKDDSHGFWRRVRLIPFLHKFEGQEQNMRLTAELQGEAPGILAWMVSGCLEWRRRGLASPQQVKSATESFRQLMDAVGEFIEDECVLDTGAEVSSADIWTSYLDYCNENREQPPLTRKEFSARLEAKGLSRARTDDRKRTRIWKGIRLKTSLESYA
jgi:putative DNA primase/helicase